jgi:TetR/AcrR family transcriptional regulator, acrAB operon repressor
MYIMAGMRRTKEEARTTRAALVDAALPVFAERGYAAATLADIAARAGVTRGAAYHHFSDKAQLYLTAMAHHWAEATAPVWQHLAADGPPLARVRRFLVAYLTALERDARFQAVQEVAMFRTEALPELEPGLRAKAEALRAWTAELTALFAQAAARGELRPGLSPETAALAVVAAVTGVTATYLASRDLLSPAERAEELAGAVLAGLA